MLAPVPRAASSTLTVPTTLALAPATGSALQNGTCRAARWMIARTRCCATTSATAALSAITAAVVGVVLNLAVWFTINTAFARVETVDRYGIRLLLPDVTSINVAAVAITLLAVLAIFKFKISVLKTLLVCAGLGLLSALVTGVA